MIQIAEINAALGLTADDHIVYSVNPDTTARIVFVTLDTVSGKWSAVLREAGRHAVTLIDGAVAPLVVVADGN